MKEAWNWKESIILVAIQFTNAYRHQEWKNFNSIIILSPKQTSSICQLVVYMVYMESRWLCNFSHEYKIVSALPCNFCYMWGIHLGTHVNPDRNFTWIFHFSWNSKYLLCDVINTGRRSSSKLQRLDVKINYQNCSEYKEHQGNIIYLEKFNS